MSHSLARGSSSSCILVQKPDTCAVPSVLPSSVCPKDNLSARSLIRTTENSCSLSLTTHNFLALFSRCPEKRLIRDWNIVIRASPNVPGCPGCLCSLYAGEERPESSVIFKVLSCCLNSSSEWRSKRRCGKMRCRVLWWLVCCLILLLTGAIFVHPRSECMLSSALSVSN